MILLILGFVLGVLVGGLTVRLWLRKRLIPRLKAGSDYRVLLEDVPIYEGDDLHLAKRIRLIYRKRNRRVELEAFGEMRG